MTLFDRPQQTKVFRWVVLALLGAAALTFHSLWAPLVLAAWSAAMARPLLGKVAKVTGGRRRAAGVLVVVLVMLMVIPLATLIISLSSGAIELVRSVIQSEGAKDALVTIAAGSEPAPPGGGPGLLDALESPHKIIALVKEYGAQALGVARGIAGAASKVILGLLVFVYAVYVFLVDGPAIYEWLETHSPLSEEHTRRFTAAFHETGRGLFVGVGLTGLAQGLVATITYVALGVPRALVLGLVTCISSVIPLMGTGLVWIPVAIGLFLAGKTASAVIMAAVGVAVIGSIDNLLRPVFLRFGKLELSTFVLVTSFFGGIAAFGPGGLLLGPLFVRLAKEALVLARAERSDAPSVP